MKVKIKQRNIPQIALCTLGSIVLGKFKKPTDMRSACRTLVRSLDNLLTYQDFISVQAAKSNDLFRPLGVGITDLAHWMAQRKFKYGQKEALRELSIWMEHISYYCIEASIELAKERGKCEGYDKTNWAKGIFPVDLRSDNLSDFIDIELSLDWEYLRGELKKYGIRNATLLAVAPVESSSVVVDSTNGIELPKSLISTKESRGSSLVQVAPEYEKLKDNYQLLWDQKDCIEYLKTAALIQAFVCQSISTNTFYNPTYFEGGKIPPTLVLKNIMLFHRWGGKTLYYSLISKMGAKTQLKDVVEAPKVTVEIDMDFEIEDCEACKL